MFNKIIEYIAIFLAVLVVLPVHEYAHAFVAVKCGDDTPKLQGRLTLNPFAHFDIYGILAMILVRFGWGKPVPINPANFRHYRRDCALVSIAGVTANYITAFLVYPLFILAFLYVPNFGLFDDVLVIALEGIFSLSLGLMVFNLLPFYPLDGFKLLESFNKKRGPVFRFLRGQGRIVLLVLIILGFVADITGFYYIDILGNALGFLSGILGLPITLFWGLFF